MNIEHFTCPSSAAGGRTSDILPAPAQLPAAEHRISSRMNTLQGKFFDSRKNAKSSILEVERPTFQVRFSRKSFCKKTFTLLEVVVSIAILSMGIVAALQITSTGTSRVSKAVNRWEVQHMLSQAAEYYLLAGPREEIPEAFFPFEGYQASCEIDIPEISEAVESEFRGWQLVKLIIKVTDDGGSEVGKIEMDKILRTEDVE